MAEYTENPPPPAAPDYPPENAFDIQSFVEQAVKTLREQKVGAADPDAASSKDADAFIKVIAWLLSSKGDTLAKVAQAFEEIAETVAKTGIDLFVAFSEPLRNIMGALTKTYVTDLVQGQGELSRVLGGQPAGLHEDAAGMFQALLGPMLGLDGKATSPTESGAGGANSQYALGSIIQIHLQTWVMDMIGSMLGTFFENSPVNPFGWIHSFDRCITTTLNARAINRIAMRPYLEKYIKDPLTRDLNVKFPMEFGGVSALIKRYIRGNMSAEELKHVLRGKGYDDEVVADMLLDTAKLLSADGAAWAVKNGFWTEEQAIRELQYLGYTAEMARVVLQMQLTAQIDSEGLSLAHSLIDAMVDRRIDQETVRRLLASTALTEDEINAMVTRGAILQELSRRLTLSQVKSLFAESLVDLDYVLNFLRDEGYSDQDADLLALLEFTKAADRAQRKKDLLERRRVALEAQLGYEKEADAARAAELAALGGPTS
jgi:hypothetical protein